MNIPYKNRVNQAIVVGGGLNALGIVRSLGSVGVPLIVVDSNPASPAMRSRYGRKHLVASLEGDSLVESLLALTRELSTPPVLFLTEEKSVNTVSAQRERIMPAFLIRLPQHERLMQLMHKQGFSELAEACRAPVPRTVRIQKQEDLAQLSRLRFPCVFKPSEKSYEYGARFQKAYKVKSAEEVAALFADIAPVLPDMVAQEWIEGEDDEIYFCLQYLDVDGAVVSSFTGRKIRSWPPRIGGTASCTAAWEFQDTLTEMTRAFFAEVGFSGMGSMEYKRDSRDGKFYMVEPTVGRTDYQQEVATLNGVNIPFAAYLHEVDLPAPGVKPRSQAVIWRDPQADKWSFEQGGGKVDRRSAGAPVADAYLRWNDPLPWIDFMLERVRSRLKK
ncbi:carboxylate--amine ligase [Herbaspirillum lusitanum]|uniref:Carboxylate--amine ligase n=1 Tax=Herbaspirillum lusitanum TaxID=213312 RepID=A0ABW9A5E9_9BURK